METLRPIFRQGFCMTFTFPDVAVIILYFVITLIIGIGFGRKGGSSLQEYFLSGRSAPWWVAGTGMVATTFAADTPLAVTGLTAEKGIAGNWLWWSAALGGVFTVFFFAKLWRRAEVLTDLEIIKLRYGSGPGARFLRGFRAVYFGLIMNILILGWVNLAMMKLLSFALPQYDPRLLIVASAFITWAYTAFSGLKGLTAADIFQFTVAMTGSVALAWFSVNSEAFQNSGGISALSENIVRFFPFLSLNSGTADQPVSSSVYSISVWDFLIFATIQWWASWYPGAEPGGGGYVAQRIMSAKNEKEGILSVLWFNTAHYALRPWPWILTALASMVIFSHLAPGEKEQGYILMMGEVLPSPWKGLMVAAFAGAYMSTLSTQLNWGAGYIINDLYKEIHPDRDDKHYINTAKIITFILLGISFTVTFWLIDTVSGAWKLLLEFGAGSGFVLMMRWYWWRLNIWSEFTSVGAPVAGYFLIKTGVPLLAASGFLTEAAADYAVGFPGTLALNALFTVIITLLVTGLTSPVDRNILIEFYKKILPPGAGWEPVRSEIPELQSFVPEKTGPLFAGWAAGVILVYSLLFFSGSLLFQQFTASALWGAAAAASGFYLWRTLLVKRQSI